MAGPQEVHTDSDRTVRVPSNLTGELAALTLAILDKEIDRTATMRKFNEDLKKLKKRQRDVATQIRAGGVQLSLADFEHDGDEDHDA